MKISEKLKYWDDHLNPVLVKEVRQYFHNRLFLSLVGGLLGIQLLILFVFNLTFAEWKDSSDTGTIYIIIETALMYLFVFITAIWHPMQNFTAERSSKELDFSNITLLSPWQIVGGKLASSLVIWGLIASLCLPFMTVGYFFRNVSLTDIFLIFGAGVMPALILIQAALLAGTMGKKWFWALFVFFAVQVVAPGVIASTVPLIIKETMPAAANLLILWICQAGWLMLFAILLAATIALLTPVYANRMLPLRILLVLLLIPTLGVLLFLKKFPSEIQELLPCITLGLVSFFPLLAACDRDEPGGRVLAKVPSNRIGKFLHCLFSSNRRGGIVLALIVLAIFGIVMLIAGIDGRKTMLPIAFGIAGYVTVYGQLAIWLNRRVPQLPGWMAMLIIAFALGVIPMIAATDSEIEVNEILLSPFCLLTGKKSIFDWQVYVAPLTAGLLGIVFIADMSKHYKDYKAPEQKEIPSTLEEKEG